MPKKNSSSSSSKKSPSPLPVEIDYADLAAAEYIVVRVTSDVDVSALDGVSVSQLRKELSTGLVIYLASENEAQGENGETTREFRLGNIKNVYSYVEPRDKVLPSSRLKKLFKPSLDAPDDLGLSSVPFVAEAVGDKEAATTTSKKRKAPLPAAQKHETRIRVKTKA